MPVISSFYGIDIKLYFRDHFPPHSTPITVSTVQRSRSLISASSQAVFRDGQWRW
jgi:hypothetical protein